MQLQGSSEDIITAYRRVQGILVQLHSICENATREFEGILKDANALAELSGSEINIPRRCVIQQGRNSVQANTPEEYCRRSLFIPYNEHLINELNNRFDHASSMFALSLALLPVHVSKLTDDKIDQIYNFFSWDLPSPSSFKQDKIFRLLCLPPATAASVEQGNRC